MCGVALDRLTVQALKFQCKFLQMEDGNWPSSTIRRPELRSGLRDIACLFQSSLGLSLSVLYEAVVRQ